MLHKIHGSYSNHHKNTYYNIIRAISIVVNNPKVKRYGCTEAHPIGCAANVKSQIDFIKSQNDILSSSNGKPQNVLIIGSSTGYGLAARITAAFGYNAQTIGIFCGKQSIGTRTASPGWYNTAAFQKYAHSEGLYSKNIIGDAFSHQTKQQTVDIIKSDLKEIDLVIYSLASSKRKHPNTGITHKSILKPIGQSITKTGIDTDKEIIKQFTLNPASETEIEDTVAVMGGEDWKMWIDKLSNENVLSSNAKTTAFTYLGSHLARDIYWNGTIGAAKKHLDETVYKLNDKYDINASVSVLTANITQASSALPIVPLYISLLSRVMKDNDTHEGCIQQIYRLYQECLYNNNPRIDECGRYRVDDKEMQQNIQNKVSNLMETVNNDNFKSLSDFDGFKTGFLQLFGFNIDGIEYDKKVEIDVNINVDDSNFIKII